MASYGTFVTACGFEYHGPKGYISFAPKWNKENFKAPFTSAEGWGTYSQQKTGLKQIHNLELKYGSLMLNKISLEKSGSGKLSLISAQLGGKQIPLTFKQENNSVEILLKEALDIQKKQILTIIMS
ncbi:hypothetical protein D3C86_1686810 [compost metagenome]